MAETNKPPHGDLPKISIGHRQENEAHDGRCGGTVGTHLEHLSHHLISRHRLWGRGKGGKGRRNPAKGIQITSLLYDAALLSCKKSKKPRE